MSQKLIKKREQENLEKLEHDLSLLDAKSTQSEAQVVKLRPKSKDVSNTNKSQNRKSWSHLESKKPLQDEAHVRQHPKKSNLQKSSSLSLSMHNISPSNVKTTKSKMSSSSFTSKSQTRGEKSSNGAKTSKTNIHSRLIKVREGIMSDSEDLKEKVCLCLIFHFHEFHK